MRSVVNAAKVFPMKVLIGLCTMASFRSPNELPWIPNKDDIDGPLVPQSDAACIESAVVRGRLMAEAIRRAVSQ